MRASLRLVAPALALLLPGACTVDADYDEDDGYGYYEDGDTEYYEYYGDYDNDPY